MEAPLTAEQLAEYVVANYTLATWTSKFGLSVVELTPAQLVAAATAAQTQPPVTRGL